MFSKKKKKKKNKKKKTNKQTTTTKKQTTKKQKQKEQQQQQQKQNSDSNHLSNYTCVLKVSCVYTCTNCMQNARFQVMHTIDTKLYSHLML